MAVSATAKSLVNADSYSTKWHQKRIHRKLDDRDDVLDEALQILESHDASALPFITSATGIDLASTGNASGPTVAFAIGGAGCTAASSATLVVGSTSVDVTAGTNEVTVDVDADFQAVMNAGSAGDILPLYLRVDDVLCPVLTLVLS